MKLDSVIHRNLFLGRRLGNTKSSRSGHKLCHAGLCLKKIYIYSPALPHIEYSFHLPIEYQTNNRPLSAHTQVWEAISKPRASFFIRGSKHLETIKARRRRRSAFISFSVFETPDENLALVFDLSLPSVPTILVTCYLCLLFRMLHSCQWILAAPLFFKFALGHSRFPETIQGFQYLRVPSVRLILFAVYQ